jgi:hypothetical protein
VQCGLLGPGVCGWFPVTVVVGVFLGGGISPICPWSRTLLYQSIHSMIAISVWWRVFQGPWSEMSSALNVPLSASAIEWKTPAEALDDFLHSAQHDSVATTP